jgi:transcriptional regulator with PAS, ATPase and Fis domain
MIRGLSPAWRDVEHRIERAASTHATVLLRGESGTGKELVAHAIHGASPRARQRFVTVNCGAIPETLLESELFGHARGAFTGAVSDKPGRFEEADGATLFLDEVGELTPALQVKLLRALESGEVARLGATGPARRVDVRIITATNRPLEAMIREGTFREDLYYRLNVVSIRLPPLREYREAIPPLARALLREFAEAYGRPVRDLQPDTEAALLAHDYPGNVRELRNLIEQAVVLETSESLRPESLPDELRNRAAGSAARARSEGPPVYREAARLFEREYLAEVLRRCQGDVARAADLAGLHRVQLYRMIRRQDLNLADFRLAEPVARRLLPRVAAATGPLVGT